MNYAERNDGKFCMLVKTTKEKLASEAYKLYFSKDKIEKCFMHMKHASNEEKIQGSCIMRHNLN